MKNKLRSFRENVLHLPIRLKLFPPIHHKNKKMKKLTSFVGAVALFAMSVVNASGTVLVYDGFANSAYGVSANANGTLSSYPGTYNNTMTGFANAKWQMNGGQPKVWGKSLGFPACFADAGIAPRGEWSIGPNSGGNQNANRNASRKLATDVLAVSDGTLFLRVLMHIDPSGVATMASSSDTMLQSNGSTANYYGLGLAPATGTAYNLLSGTNGAFGFFFVKNKAGNVGLFFRAKDAAGTNLEVKLCDVSNLVSGLSDQNTFVAFASIGVNAGADGKEVICAGASKIGDYSVTAVAAALEQPIGQAEIIGETVYPKALVFDGCYQTQGVVLFDEFAVATAADDVLVLSTDQPIFGDCTMTKVSDGVFSLSAPLARNDADIKVVLSAAGFADKVIPLGSFTEGSTASRTLTASGDGIDPSAEWSVSVVAENDAGTDVYEFPGTYFFGRDAVLSDFAKKVDISVGAPLAAALGSAELVNFPVLVRINETTVPGFYSELVWANGSDFVFADSENNILPYEIDTWDAAGTSLVWVRVPKLSSDTVISLYYGSVFRVVNTPSGAWSEYAGVWHVNEASGTAFDSTVHALDGSPSGSASASMIATNGIVGSARVNSPSKSYLSIPSYNSLNVGSTFTISGWFKANAVSGYPRIFSRKNNYDANEGFEMEMAQNSKTQINARGVLNNKGFTFKSPDITADWVHIAVTYDGATAYAYTNGFLSVSAAIDPATDNGKPLSVGCNSNGSEAAFDGRFDEIRLSMDALPAAWVAADYLVVAEPASLSYSAPADVDTAAPVLETPSIVRDGATGAYTATIEMTAGAGAVSAVFDEIEVPLTSGAVETAPQTYHCTPTLAGDTMYRVSAHAVSAAGTEVSKTLDEAFYSGALSVERVADASEKTFTDGSFRIVRASTQEACRYPLAVTYTVSGTAVAGKTYKALSGSAVIPAGESSVALVVTPLLDMAVYEDSYVTVTLSPGLYGIGSGSATLAIENLYAPDGYNTWVATADGYASNPANWSNGAPTASDHILFDGAFSSANAVWDSSAPHTVAGWTQANGYSGTVTIGTTYPDYAQNFTVFMVDGDVNIESGTLAHTSHGTSATQMYRLRLDVTGDLTIGAAGKISGVGLGRYSDFWNTKKCAPHGGATNGKTYANGMVDPFDAIFEPVETGWGCDNGTGGGRAGPGGGALYITVAGNVLNDGTVSATSGKANEAGGAGGSIYVSAANIRGTGKFSADGARCDKGDGCGASGAGGRVALVAEDDNDFTRASVTAFGSRESSYWNQASEPAGSAAAGTVYLACATNREVSVRSKDSGIVQKTPIPATDDPADWRRGVTDVNIVADTNAHLVFTRVIRAHSLDVAPSSADVDLGGQLVTIHALYTNGVRERIGSGDYSAEMLNNLGYAWALDSSEGATGILRIDYGVTALLFK